MTLLLLVALAQTPVVPVQQSAEVQGFSAFVDRQLLTASISFNSIEVKRRERVFHIQDEDLEEAFKLVPETLPLVRRAREQYQLATALQITGLVFLGAAIVPIVLGIVISGALIPLLIVASAMCAVSVVFSLLALPIELAAQEKFFAAVGSYNHGLLRLNF
ncbi:MAG: hypothetical protein ACO1OB_20765 [Archangium sp.]